MIVYQNGFYGKIGISEIPVEIDETHMISRRDNRGRILRAERYWILGCICRSTKQIRLKLFRNGSESTCLNFVNNNINIGLIIYSDMWKGYRNLNLNGYNHFTVNHSVGFINFENNKIHT